ncbi:MAG: asparagine synthase (glutamine-hydrolyzing) [Bacteroidetes bacterium]|nr:MAG: asparagine synthase (glutamine-hydrolyzing) [Bacteroidota bacterium]
MCGICGIINFDKSPINPEPLQVMMRTMKHRGPDDEGIFTDDVMGLGFVRLSIIDLSTGGHQPMFSEDRRYVIVYNGEIFNYIELRETLIQVGYRFKTKTDTEVLLNAFREWGQQMLDKLNGMWSFVIFDRKEKKLFGARDRYGIKPFYYFKEKNRLIFASEIPSILSLLDKKPTPDLSAIFDYLAFNRTDQTERTFFEEVKKLNHGHAFTLDLKENDTTPQNAMNIYKWYDLRKALKNGLETPDDFRDLFSSSVGLRLRSDVPVGVCLSGGLDSSSIVSVLLKDYLKKDLNTFSAVYGNGHYGDESAFIKLFQPHLKKMYFIRPDESTLLKDIEPFVKAHAEPVPSTSPYAQFKVMSLAKEHVTVTLDGQGADEALAGYHYFFGFYFKELLQKGKLGRLTTETMKYLKNHRSIFGLKTLLFFLLPSNLRTKLRVQEKGYIARDFAEVFQEEKQTIPGELYGSESLQDALINHFEYKLEHLLKWEDRNAMWYSLEARVPFLDFRLVEKVLSLQGTAIINNGMTKYILRQAMKGTIPEPIRLRQDKIGFGTPQDEWFRKPAFQNYIKDILNASSFSGRKLIDVDRAKKIYQKHLDRKGNYGKEIWKWIHLEQWHREFID